MQGTVLAPLKCSVSIDNIGKEALEKSEGNLLKYRNCVSIPPLSLIDDIIAITKCSHDAVVMNAFIEAKTQDLQLELGFKKCCQLHVGCSSDTCSTLTVQSQEMVKASKQMYLGDLLSADGKIDNNINERFSKGIGIVNQIITLLKEVHFGKHYFEMAILFRNSMLVNSVLCSIESLYGLKKSHIEKLESCDKYLMRKLFNSVSTTAVEAYYLETGTLPLRFYISARRLMFLWNILQKPESELVNQVYNAQKLSPVENDWFLQVQDDLRMFQINLSDDEIKSLKKEKFKHIVKKSVREQGETYLYNLKKNHSKSQNLGARFQLQDYLTCDELNVQEKQLLFKFRTRTYDCKMNYRKMYEPDLSCLFCNGEDSQEHLIACKITDDMNTEGIFYGDIFDSAEKQTKITKVLKQIDNKRFLSKKSSNVGGQVHREMPHIQ